VWVKSEVRTDTLAARYEGPFKVIGYTHPVLTILKKEKPYTINIDRTKPAWITREYIADNDSSDESDSDEDYSSDATEAAVLEDRALPPLIPNHIRTEAGLFAAPIPTAIPNRIRTEAGPSAAPNPTAIPNHIRTEVGPPVAPKPPEQRVRRNSVPAKKTLRELFTPDRNKEVPRDRLGFGGLLRGESTKHTRSGREVKLPSRYINDTINNLKIGLRLNRDSHRDTGLNYLSSGAQTYAQSITQQ
jgi:hypothetical protein